MKKTGAMNILMVAPEPFFQPRGTPFSEYYRIKCLCELGHKVDLVTYPIGDDVSIPGLEIHRARRIPGINTIKIGPSLAKIPLDISLFFKTWGLLLKKKYDAIHSHEEAGIMAVFFSRMFGLPHIYDMHSSLPDQLETFRFTKSRLLKAAFDWLESTVLESADSVIAICPALVEKALKTEPNANVTLIENVAESHFASGPSEDSVNQLRRELRLEEKEVILYMGTFETYQGLGILLEACKKLFQTRQKTVLLLVGGRTDQVDSVKKRSAELGIGDRSVFTGTVPHNEVPAYLQVADVLVSPRRFGTNTPLKIYSYLRSGKPIVATKLYTHTQVLNDQVAELVGPDPESLSAGLSNVLGSPDRSAEMVSAAIRLSENKFNYRDYIEKTKQIFDYIEVLSHA